MWGMRLRISQCSCSSQPRSILKIICQQYGMWYHNLYSNAQLRKSQGEVKLWESIIRSQNQYEMTYFVTLKLLKYSRHLQIIFIPWLLPWYVWPHVAIIISVTFQGLTLFETWVTSAISDITKTKNWFYDKWYKKQCQRYPWQNQKTIRCIVTNFQQDCRGQEASLWPSWQVVL